MGDSNHFDVAIIGTGPAGGAAAIELAGSGLRVALIEKQNLPRYKTCGGGVLHRAVKLLPIDISSVVQSECVRVALNLSDKLHFAVERPAAIVSMVMRDEFDHLLVRHATGHGVELLSDREVTGVESNGNAVKLRTSHGDLTARYVIAADGAAGRIGKFANLPEHRKMIPAMEWECFVDASTFARFAIEARFDFDAIPFGYGWVFPKREHLSIGVGSWRKSIDLKKNLTTYLHRLGIAPTRIESHGFVIPMLDEKIATRTFAKDRILFTGDAAGLADPVTAEGIGPAIRSGQLAASAIKNYFDHPAEAANLYQSYLNEQILPELRAAANLSRLLYFRPRLRNLLFRLLGQRLAETMTDIVTGETTYTEVLNRFRSGW